jgi:hypothetical protein
LHRHVSRAKLARVRASLAARAAIALLVLPAAACLPVVSPAAYPLYPKIDGGPGPGKVSLLRGPIAIVDGERVSGKGPAFELLPGCHLVALEAGADAKAPQIIFAFEMRPGYIYTIEPGAEVAQEHAPDGSVAAVRRARASDVTDCRSWAKSQRY